jgi:hypothetical protein
MSHSLGATTIKQFDNLIDKIGIWTVYTRSDHRFRCRDCWDYDTNSSAPDCGTCFGTGFRVTLERWLTYYTNRISRVAGVDTPLTRAGFSPEHNAYIFTRHRNIPVEQDRFFIVEWDKDRDRIPVEGGRPARLVQALRVIFVETFYIGREIYYLAHCGIHQEAIKQYEPNLLRSPLTVTRL